MTLRLTLAVILSQSFGSQGTGTQVGVDSPFFGRTLRLNRTLDDSDQNLIEGPETNIGFEKQISKNTTVGASQGSAGSQTLSLSRRDDDKSFRFEQEKRGSLTSRRFIEEEEMGGYTRYTQSSTDTDSRDGDTSYSRIQGMKTKILNNQALVYSEDEFTSKGSLVREGRRTGVGFRPNENTEIDFVYERHQDKDGDKLSRDSHVGGVHFQYADFNKLQAENTWEIRRDSGTEELLQLYSDGFFQYKFNPEWTWYSRYEWSWSNGETSSLDLARFTEAQMGIAFRPINHDKLNILAEVKFLNDEGTSEQIGILNALATKSTIYRAELIYDLTPHISLVEKFAFRDKEILLDASDAFRTKTYLSAHRVNWRPTDRWGLGAEYRILTFDTIDQVEHGFLVEGTVRVVDELSMAVGYNFTEVDSDTDDLLEGEAEGWYVRLFIDPSRHIENAVQGPKIPQGPLSPDVYQDLKVR